MFLCRDNKPFANNEMTSHVFGLALKRKPLKIFLFSSTNENGYNGTDVHLENILSSFNS